ncbi:MAG: TIGR04423 family type III CRISPR-associated protein [Bacteroidales bacterium]|nr:TIGR04423 family type III CRISPR-associated protein [Bacteroidales bacterium]
MLDFIKRYNSIKEIPNRNYEGYVWLSNEKKPFNIPDESFDFLTVEANPFVVEALLFDKNENKSIHVQHSGEYQIFEYDLSKLEKSNLVEKEYLPHRLKDVEKVLFKQIWLPEKDENCAGFDVLKLKAIVFSGFKNKEE